MTSPITKEQLYRQYYNAVAAAFYGILQPKPRVLDANIEKKYEFRQPENLAEKLIGREFSDNEIVVDMLFKGWRDEAVLKRLVAAVNGAINEVVGVQQIIPPAILVENIRDHNFSDSEFAITHRFEELLLVFKFDKPICPRFFAELDYEDLAEIQKLAARNFKLLSKWSAKTAPEAFVQNIPELEFTPPPNFIGFDRTMLQQSQVEEELYRAAIGRSLEQSFFIS